MNIQRSLGIFFSVVIMVGCGLLIIMKNNDDRPAVGVVQTASHPALDAVYRGFVAELTKKAGDRCAIIYQNAEGQIPQAQTIVQSFHNNQNIKAIMSIATPTTQVAVNKEKMKPIIFAAVTSVGVLGLDPAQNNVCGVEDRVDVAMMVQLVEFCARTGKRVGMVYNPSEVNSVTLVAAFEKALQEKGFDPIHIGIAHESEIQQVISAAVQKADILIAPTDNMVALAIEQITKVTQQAKIPFIASDLLLLNQGVTAACGVNYELSGQQAGAIAYRLLFENTGAADIGVVRGASSVAFNQAVCQSLGIDTTAFSTVK